MDSAVIVPGRIINQAMLKDVKIYWRHISEMVRKEHQNLSFYKDMVEARGGTEEQGDSENVCADTS